MDGVPAGFTAWSQSLLQVEDLTEDSARHPGFFLIPQLRLKPCQRLFERIPSGVFTSRYGICPSPLKRIRNAAAARELVEKVLAQLSPAARLVITLLEIEDRSVKEVAALTGWSVPVVKIRAFRARAQMRKCLEKLARGKYL